MRMMMILALLSSALISCATIQGLVGDSQPPTAEEASLDGSSPATSPDLGAPAAGSDQAYTNTEMGDGSQAPAEAQAAEQQTAHAEAMNEQRSTSELDAAAPESSGTDSFYASTNTTPGIPETPAAEVEQVIPETKAQIQLPTELPEKGASWDQAAANSTPESSYDESQHEEKPAFKKSSKKSKKQLAKKDKKSKKHLAKKDKKSKKQLAKKDKKSKKQIAKKSKQDCKKIAKNTKKSKKREIAMCKAEKRSVASVKSKKLGKLAKAGCQQCNVR